MEEKKVVKKTKRSIGKVKIKRAKWCRDIYKRRKTVSMEIDQKCWKCSVRGGVCKETKLRKISSRRTRDEGEIVVRGSRDKYDTCVERVIGQVKKKMGGGGANDIDYVVYKIYTVKE